jgi:asparagine synthase (glutamine-hydrolysing)
MCGIAGIYDLSGHHRADFETLRGMCDQIRHRGPDGDGYFTAPNVRLGMRRLSIIDVEGSEQPLYNEDRTIAMVFNGEIYNYRELRAELVQQGHAFNTDGDGETLIHLYEQYGLDFFNKLRGMYAFALWDGPNARLLVAIDHIGMKPLYLAERDGRLLFSSEVKALFADPSMRREIDLDVLDTYLSFGYPLGDETLFAGVRRLRPGHALIAERGSTRLFQHWSFPKPSATHDTRPESEIIADARRLLAESVHLHLRADVPLGLFLSGGIDSAAILGLMAQEASGRIKTFTVGYQTATPDNELLHARRIAEHFNTDHHERVITAEDWWNTFEQYVYYHDEPNANPSAVSLMLLSELTAKEVKVVLTGLGGDELFGGYMHHRAIPWLMQTHARVGWLSPLGAPLGAVERYYPAFKRYRYVGALPTYLPRVRQALMSRDEGLRRMQSYDGMVLTDSLRRRLYGSRLKSAWKTAQHKETTYREILARSLRNDPYDTAQALVINTWLTGNALLSQDKTAMAWSLEARVPFFDPALLAFAANLPPSLRMRANKYVLREAMRPLLPEFALERPKQPFGTPILNWFGSELQSRIEAVLLDESATVRELFDRDALEKLLRAHFSGRESHVELIFRLLTLELWARRFRMTPTAQPAAPALWSPHQAMTTSS